MKDEQVARGDVALGQLLVVSPQGEDGLLQIVYSVECVLRGVQVIEIMANEGLEFEDSGIRGDIEGLVMMLLAFQRD